MCGTRKRKDAQRFKHRPTPSHDGAESVVTDGKSLCFDDVLRKANVVSIVLLALWPGRPALAEEITTVEVTIRDHRFSPSEIHVPAGKPTIIRIKNEDATAEEFESTALKVEKVIAGGAAGAVRLRPLGPGRYPFLGEYHADTAKGVVISE